MKMWLLIGVLTLGLGACSSNEKKAEKVEEVKKEAAKDATEKKKDMKAASTGDKATCESKNDKRHIEVRGAGEGCELAYTKFGKEEVVATSALGFTHCKTVAERIKSNLTAAGFTCGE